MKIITKVQNPQSQHSLIALFCLALVYPTGLKISRFYLQPTRGVDINDNEFNIELEMKIKTKVQKPPVGTELDFTFLAHPSFFLNYSCQKNTSKNLINVNPNNLRAY
jgi:hypothetical protein